MFLPPFGPIFPTALTSNTAFMLLVYRDFFMRAPLAKKKKAL